MTAKKALELAHEFILEHDPESMWTPDGERIVAMAILFGMRRGINQTTDFGLELIDEVFGGLRA